jgi:predicted phosphodiesterase
MVVGDIHGSITDLFQAVQWFLSGKCQYIIFNGDLMDRGQDNIAVLLLVCDLKRKYPSQVIITRGNHESISTSHESDMSGYNSFIHRYGFSNTHTFLSRFFGSLSYVVVLQKKVTICHGCPNRNTNLNELQNERKVSEPFYGNQLRDIMWCDPKLEISGRGSSDSRGKNDLAVGKDELNVYCETNNQEIIVRSHECVVDGALYQPFDGRHLYTIFTHSQYCNKGNRAAVLFLDSRCNVSCAQWDHGVAESNRANNNDAFVDFIKGRSGADNQPYTYNNPTLKTIQVKELLPGEKKLLEECQTPLPGPSAFHFSDC